MAVIDGGIDGNHQDLKSGLWTNAKEIAGNAKDDDHNGYVDDLNGWNFLGQTNGHTLANEQREETRLYVRLKPKYEGKTRANRASFTPAQRAEFDLWTLAKSYHERKRAEFQKAYWADSLALIDHINRLSALKKALGVSRLDTTLLQRPPTADSTLLGYAAHFYRDMKRRDLSDTDTLLGFYKIVNRQLKDFIDYDYNPAYTPRSTIGDDPAKLNQRDYGNADASGGYTEGPTAHGTYAAGIIAADRTNLMGVRGIADRVQLMAVVAIPRGDERDKDVANAIRYAVDNGASIINMSFGKYFSPEKAVVDEAIRYADRKGVLLVHAAGNDGLDIDSAQQYPTSTYLNGQPVPNLITVGASDRRADSTLAAWFTNYGRHTVDVFAPGVRIWSTAPHNRYVLGSGTSVAAPVVVGMAAVLKTYFPNLMAADLKRIILQSAVVYHTPVFRPGTRQKVDFAHLSKTGGIVNLYEALKLAMAEQAIRIKK
ncbi:S8 family peptidase [Spirosoma gilvum]